MSARRAPLSMSPAALAAHCVLPGLVIAMVAGNQGWAFSGLLVGQVLSWFIDLAALVIVVDFCRGQKWPYALALGILLTRVVGSGFQGASRVDLAYIVLLNGLFCAAGVAMALQYTPWVRRQLRWICLLSTIFMVMQTLGVGEWTQFLATENEGRPKTPRPTLFVQLDDLQYQTIQARPSGLLHSNNFLSVIVLFALALELSDRRRKRLNRWDVTLAAMAVLSMAKIVALVTAVMIGWLLLFGTPPQRRRAIRFTALIVALLGLYRVLFPGLFEISTGSSQIAFSFYIRLNDFVERLDPGNPLVTFLSPYLVDTPRLLDRDNDTGFSGYAAARRLLPYLLAAAVVLIPIAWHGFKKLRRIEPFLCSASMLVGIAAALYPAAVPFFGAQLYWFMVGFVVLPLVVVLMPLTLKRAGIAPQASRPSGSRGVKSRPSASVLTPAQGAP